MQNPPLARGVLLFLEPDSERVCYRLVYQYLPEVHDLRGRSGVQFRGKTGSCPPPEPLRWVDLRVLSKT
jgi:hypothetical protein